MRWKRHLALGLSAAVAAGCGGGSTPAEPVPGGELAESAPLAEMGRATWKGFSGGHYPGGEAVPAAHATEGLRRARAIGPLDGEGRPDPAGKYALLSIGMSNTTQEFCRGPVTNCSAGSFVGQALADPAGRRAGLVLVDGAAGGQSAVDWIDPQDPNYTRVRDTRLAPLGLTERQVRIVWLKVANPGPRVALPDPAADAFQLEQFMGAILRAVKQRYPNLEMVFASNRTYAGYASTSLNPEPYAYESGFAVKWLVEAQIEQMAGPGNPADPVAGNLAYAGPSAAAPWVGWGPDLWASGTKPRAADGLVWLPEDFQSDGTHPSPEFGTPKVGGLLLTFFKTSEFTRCWFVQGGTC